MPSQFQQKSFILKSLCTLVILVLIFGAGYALTSEQNTAPNTATQNTTHAPLNLKILVASTRATPTGASIAQEVAQMLEKHPAIKAEIVAIADYQLSFYTDAMPPAYRKEEIVDPVLKKWSDKVLQADGFIIIAPEYNAGYPGALKNALDSLYQEWAGKPVALIGYSGGPTGGSCMLAQLRQVTLALGMVPVATDIAIPYSWEALTPDGALVDADAIEQKLNTVVDQLLAARKK